MFLYFVYPKFSLIFKDPSINHQYKSVKYITSRRVHQYANFILLQCFFTDDFSNSTCPRKCVKDM